MLWLIRDARTGKLYAVRGTYGTACKRGRIALNGCLPPYCGVVGR